jgi:hypothetical protein
MNIGSRISLAEYLLEKSPSFYLRYIEWLDEKWIVVKRQEREKEGQPEPLIRRDVIGKQFRRAMLRSSRALETSAEKAGRHEAA